MSIPDSLAAFTFGYPFLMATIWICGGIYFYVHWERKQPWPSPQSWGDDSPVVTVLLPCFNESDNIDEVVGHLFKQNYPNIEIITINDGSTDDTADKLKNLQTMFPQLNVIHQNNQGKASALNHGLSFSSGEIIVGIDGDAILDYDAIGYMVGHFLSSSKVSAVTGNPRVRTRSTIIGKIQTGEFSSIIGLIKRAQRIYGMVFTISGVVCAFRKSSLDAINGWNTDMVTEDIDVSWRLQLAGGQVRYEPRALCWVLMPETVRGLFRQRLRWAQGGGEVFLRYFITSLKWKNRRFWILLGDYMLSIVWCYSVFILLGWWALSSFFSSSAWSLSEVMLNYVGGALVTVSFIQFLVSFCIDSRYDRKIFRSAFWCIWYPFIYWILNLLTVVTAFPRAIMRQRGRNATWKSPDRGELFHGK